MTVGIPDAATALPYVGDDPAQVLVFQDGVTTARQHLNTFGADLGSARSNVNAVWHATEADTADVRTAGLLTSGESIATSLDAGSQAISAYAEVLTQGRRIVDLLREEWSIARAQASALETRTYTSAEELAAAQADARRLTDVFGDMHQQFGTVLTTVQTAAEACSRALVAAADGPKAGSSVSMASYLFGAKPKPPVVDPEGEAWWPADKTWRHDTGARAVRKALESQLEGGTFGYTIVVPDGGKNGAKFGKTDIYWIKDGVTYIWEIKGSLWDGATADAQATAASQEAKDYVADLKEAYPEQQFAVGEPLSGTIEVPYTSQNRRTLCDKYGILYDSWPDEILKIENSPDGSGGLLYTTRAIDTQAPPPPSPPPPDPPTELEQKKSMSLGDIASDALDDTGIPDLVDLAEKAAEAPGALINTALDGIKEALSDGDDDDGGG